MRTLSIRQPWAWLIVNGFKPVENRDWPTTYRGPLLIHAGLTLSKRDYAAILDSLVTIFGLKAPPVPSFEELRRGGIVGSAELVDCVTAHDSPYFTGPHGFVLREARPLPFVPCRGQLGFFDVPRRALSEVEP